MGLDVLQGRLERLRPLPRTSGLRAVFLIVVAATGRHRAGRRRGALGRIWPLPALWLRAVAAGLDQGPHFYWVGEMAYVMPGIAASCNGVLLVFGADARAHRTDRVGGRAGGVGTVGFYKCVFKVTRLILLIHMVHRALAPHSPLLQRGGRTFCAGAPCRDPARRRLVMACSRAMSRRARFARNHGPGCGRP